MKSSRLFHRDFTIMVVGQIMSLFGNTILRFALSLYVLDITGSAAVFGGILALSMLPMVFLSPVGGFLADRLPKQKIMVALDFSTAGIIALFSLLFQLGDSLILIGGVMMLLAVIQACYQPSVQASIPAITTNENLAAANGVVVQVQALATLVGPIAAGLFYGFAGITPILWASCLCFFLSAVMELFLRIPFFRPVTTGSPLRQLRSDLGEAFRFLHRDNPGLLRLLIVIAGINLFVSAFYVVGLPYLVRIHLGLSAQMSGFAEGALSLGSIVGGVLSGVILKRVSFQRSHRFLIMTAVLILPLVAALAAGLPPLGCYTVLMLSLTASMVSVVLFNIAAQTYLQQATPAALLGKVASFVSAICMCAAPVGQGLYGVLLEAFQDQVWLVGLLAAVAGILLALATGRALKRLSPIEKISQLSSENAV